MLRFRPLIEQYVRWFALRTDRSVISNEGKDDNEKGYALLRPSPLLVIHGCRRSTANLLLMR